MSVTRERCTWRTRARITKKNERVESASRARRNTVKRGRSHVEIDFRVLIRRNALSPVHAGNRRERRTRGHRTRQRERDGEDRDALGSGAHPRAAACRNSRAEEKVRPRGQPGSAIYPRGCLETSPYAVLPFPLPAGAARSRTHVRFSLFLSPPSLSLSLPIPGFVCERSPHSSSLADVTRLAERRSI